MYQIRTTPTFDKDIKRLDRQIAKRIIQKIEYLANHPELLRFPIKYLPKELEGLQKYRIGDWRVYLWVDHTKKEITLYGVEHRGRAYKSFKK
jgi:mRNA-degrading endonuclease RelE of RelBE toxin-antitoxin system